MKSQIIHVICSPHGGIATYVLGAIEARSNKNESIYLFSNHDKSDLSFKKEVKKFIKNKNLIFEGNLNTHKKPILKTFKDIFLIKNLVDQLNEKDKKDKNLFLIAHGTSSAGIVSIVSILTKSDFIYIPHGGLSHLYKESNNLKKLFVYIFDIFLLMMGAKFIFESKNTFSTYQLAYKRFPNFLKRKLYKKYIYSFTKKHIGKIKNTKFLNNNNQLLKNKKCIKLTYMGTWREIKGIKRLIKILKTFKDNDFYIEGVKLIFEIYSDKDPSKIKNFNPDYISFKYWVDNPFYVIEKTDIVIIPSIWESFGYSAIDSILLEKPVIHTNQGGLSEIFEGSKMPVLSINFDKQDLIKAIRFISNSSFDILMKESNFIKNAHKKSWWELDNYKDIINI